VKEKLICHQYSLVFFKVPLFVVLAARPTFWIQSVQLAFQYVPANFGARAPTTNATPATARA